MTSKAQAACKLPVYWLGDYIQRHWDTDSETSWLYSHHSTEHPFYHPVLNFQDLKHLTSCTFHIWDPWAFCSLVDNYQGLKYSTRNTFPYEECWKHCIPLLKHRETNSIWSLTQHIMNLLWETGFQKQWMQNEYHGGKEKDRVNQLFAKIAINLAFACVLYQKRAS